MVGTVVLGQLGLFLATRCPDDRRSDMARPLAHDQAGTAGRGMEQHRVVGGQGVGARQQVAGCESLEQAGGDRLVGEVVRDTDQSAGRHVVCLRIGAHPARICHSIPFL